MAVGVGGGTLSRILAASLQPHPQAPSSFPHGPSPMGLPPWGLATQTTMPPPPMPPRRRQGLRRLACWCRGWQGWTRPRSRGLPRRPRRGGRSPAPQRPRCPCPPRTNCVPWGRTFPPPIITWHNLQCPSPPPSTASPLHRLPPSLPCRLSPSFSTTFQASHRPSPSPFKPPTVLLPAPLTVPSPPHTFLQEDELERRSKFAGHRADKEVAAVRPPHSRSTSQPTLQIRTDDCLPNMDSPPAPHVINYPPAPNMDCRRQHGRNRPGRWHSQAKATAVKDVAAAAAEAEGRVVAATLRLTVEKEGSVPNKPISTTPHLGNSQMDGGGSRA